MNELRIIFLGFTIPNDIAEYYFELDPNPAIQTHKFAWSLARALSMYQETILISSIPMQNFPLVKKIFIGSRRFIQSDIKGITIPFINILVLKHLTRFLSGFVLILYSYCKQKPFIIFIHGSHTPYLLLGLIFRALRVKTAVILTDPAGVELNTDSLLSKFLKRIDKRFNHYLVKSSDVLIALAPKLIEDLGSNAIKLITPGILNKEFSNSIISQNEYVSPIDKIDSFNIVYAGGLHDAYGVKTLVDAILTSNKKLNIKMFFLGKGNQLGYIKEAAIKDTRIEYHGFLDNSKLIPYLLNADLLINPRPASLGFSSQSFPSKLIEYLATGTPVLTTRIESIPVDLEEFFYYIEDESEVGIQKAIVKVMQENPTERKLKGLNAKKYIESAYSEKNIAEKIHFIIRQLSHN